MQRLMNKIAGFLQSEDGPTTTEYAVMLALIVVVAVASIILLGNRVNDTFTDVSGGLPNG